MVFNQNYRPHSLRLYYGHDSEKAEEISKITYTFCTVDDESYQWSAREGEGVASMRHPKTAKKLSELFDAFAKHLEKESIET